MYRNLIGSETDMRRNRIESKSDMHRNLIENEIVEVLGLASCHCRYVYTGWGGRLRWPETPPSPLAPCWISKRKWKSESCNRYRVFVKAKLEAPAELRKERENRKAAIDILFLLKRKRKSNTVFLGAFTHTHTCSMYPRTLQLSMAHGWWSSNPNRRRCSEWRGTYNAFFKTCLPIKTLEWSLICQIFYTPNPQEYWNLLQKCWDLRIWRRKWSNSIYM